MPNTDNKANFLFKVALGKADTGKADVNGSSKEFYAEPLSSRPTVYSSQIWSEVDKIPENAPALENQQSSGVVQYFENVLMTSLQTSVQAFYLEGLKDAIPFNFGNPTSGPNNTGYQYTIRNQAGTQIQPGQGDWVLDTAAGVLIFYGNLPTGVTLSTPPTVSFYKYIGKKGAGGGGSITISATAPADAEAGNMWWNSNTGDLLIYYNDGDTNQWVSAIGGVGGLWTLSGSTITTPYNIAKAGGSFKISHPLPELNETHHLYHSFVEGPRADLIYRGEVQLIDGKAVINIDEVSKMTNGTFEALSRNPSCFTTNETDWTPVRGKVIGNLLEIESQDPNSTSTVSWLVISERKDPAACNLEWTDAEGYPSPEVLKSSVLPPEKPQLEPITLDNFNIT